MAININIKELEVWYDPEYCLKAVERNGDALRYVKDQTESVCLKAVESDGDALQYVAKIFWDLFKSMISGWQE